MPAAGTEDERGNWKEEALQATGTKWYKGKSKVGGGGTNPCTYTRRCQLVTKTFYNPPTRPDDNEEVEDEKCRKVFFNGEINLFLNSI